MSDPMKKLLTFLSCLFLIACTTHLPGCTSTGPKGSKGSAATPKLEGEISVMTFNVENLFDTSPDKDREDFTYLPLALKTKPEIIAGCNMQKGFYKKQCLELDWNESVLAKKLQNIAEVVLSVDQGLGPDVLLLVEVENENVLNRLNSQYLQKAGYTTAVLIEGPDERGIDTAVLSRLPLVGKPQLHKIPYKGQNPEDQKWMNRSRGILEVVLKTPAGPNLTTFTTHFPSQRNPRYWREQSVMYMKEKLKTMQNEMFVFGGDLNISQDEEEETGFFEKHLGEVSLVAHQLGCQHCDGTYDFRNTWSFLDALVFSKSMSETGSAAYQFIPQSVDVVKLTKNHIYKGRSPKRFDEKTGEGISDHFPLYARIKLRSVK